MPRGYTTIRNKLKRKGMSSKAAKTKAAKIYNSSRKPGSAPVTRRKH